MANNASYVMTAGVIAARTRSLMVTRQKPAKQSCALTKSAAVCGDCLAPLVSPETRSLRGLKKAKKLPELSETLLAPEAGKPETQVLELDELWSFVLKRARKRWVWVALCRHTRQVVAYVIGDRSAASCQKLWECIPDSYRHGHCFSDFWEAYQKVIPAEQHTAAGKETGFTAHVERWNNTLRQRLGRFVRKSLSFSKSEEMHEICLRLFLHRYNLALASPA
jgi:insertion element IS1 protein InsB